MLPVFMNVFGCKKLDMMTFVVCLQHLDLNSCAFQLSSGLCRCHASLLVFNINFENFGLLCIKLESYFFYQGKTGRFQLD